MKKGFTLIEILVSVAIFSFVVLIAVGSIISILDANRKAQSLSTIVNNLNIAFESMIRDMRTGSNYSLDNAHSLSFKDKDGKDVTYCLGSSCPPSSTYSGTATSSIIKTTTNSNNAPSSLGSITGPEVVIDSMTFTVKGNNVGGTGDLLPPIVLLHITGHSGANKTQSNFNIQTVITERVLDSLDLPQS